MPVRGGANSHEAAAVDILTQVAELNEELKEVIKKGATEAGVKPAVFGKYVRAKAADRLDKLREETEELETLFP